MPMSAKDYKTEILGEWLYSEKMEDGLLSSIASYKVNGEFTIVGISNTKDEYFSYTVKGKWTIEGNIIKYTLTESNIPKYMKVGDSWTRTIKSIDKKQFKYLHEEKEGLDSRLPIAKVPDVTQPRKNNKKAKSQHSNR